MTDLLDINLLVSLAWPNHVHHIQALAWFRRRCGQPWATTPLTEADFVRVSSNTSALPAAVTPTEALALLNRMREVAEHQFLADDVPQVVGAYLAPEQVATTDRSRMPTCWWSLVATGHALPLSIEVLWRWLVATIWCWLPVA